MRFAYVQNGDRVFIDDTDLFDEEETELLLRTAKIIQSKVKKKLWVFLIYGQ